MSATVQDTPTRYTISELPLGMQPTACELDAEVEKEVVGHRRVTPTEEFLQILLPCHVDEGKIFDKIRQRHYSQPTGGSEHHWKDLPIYPRLESDLYAPFVCIAMAIQDSAVELYVSGDDERKNTYVRGSWVNCANRYPRSVREESARVRPDIGLFTRTHDIEALTELVVTLDQTLKSIAQRGEEVKSGDQRDLTTVERFRTMAVLALSTIPFHAA